MDNETPIDELIAHLETIKSTGMKLIDYKISAKTRGGSNFELEYCRADDQRFKQNEGE